MTQLQLEMKLSFYSSMMRGSSWFQYKKLWEAGLGKGLGHQNYKSGKGLEWWAGIRQRFHGFRKTNWFSLIIRIWKFTVRSKWSSLIATYINKEVHQLKCLICSWNKTNWNITSKDKYELVSTVSKKYNGTWITAVADPVAGNRWVPKVLSLKLHPPLVVQWSASGHKAAPNEKVNWSRSMICHSYHRPT